MKMNKIFYIFLIFGHSYVQGLPDDEKAKMMAAMMPHVQECSKQHGVSDEQIKEAKGTGKVDEIHSCLMGCIYKRINVIDDKGFFDLEKAAALYKEFFSAESDKKYISEHINACAKVNKDTVTDGDKGCHRGRLLNECLMPFQKEFYSMK